MPLSIFHGHGSCPRSHFLFMSKGNERNLVFSAREKLQKLWVKNIWYK